MSIFRPEEFLSERAINRRLQQQIPIDSLDLPVNKVYIRQVLLPGVQLIHASKWMNGITVRTDLAKLPDAILNLSFVKEVQLTKRNQVARDFKSKFVEYPLKSEYVASHNIIYGESIHQISQLNVDYLHELDFKGDGLQIAILDAGFSGVEKFPAFNSLWNDNRILGTKDFVEGDLDVYKEHHHGMSVLSCLAGNITGQLIGTAPKASYWLLRTEDANSEYILEEDNWIAAAEFADSAGVDIINTSLGYNTFDDPEMDHTYAEMDGSTTRITRGANIAVSRGMLVVASAGNEGRNNNLWRYIVAPADGDDVLAIGAVNINGLPAPFTSLGPASDGDIKPNVAAMGWNTIIQRANGTIGTGNGTSFSAPLVAGAAACLWQTSPGATAKDIKEAIEHSAHLHASPDTLAGYGIPDFKLALEILNASGQAVVDKKSIWEIYPNPFNDFIVLQKNKGINQGKIQLAFLSLDGKLLRLEEKLDAAKIRITNLQNLPAGVLLLQVRTGNSVEAVKIVKLNGAETNTF